jgi:hypothetical protein
MRQLARIRLQNKNNPCEDTIRQDKEDATSDILRLAGVFSGGLE